MTATPYPRPPLGLPPGSIRGLLSLQIAIVFWLLLIIPSDPDRKIPIPLGDLESAMPICNACTAPHIFRPDED